MNSSIIMPSNSTKDNKNKYFTFTSNNYTSDTEKCIQSFAVLYCTYLIYGREIAPQTGTPHLQGYFILRQPSRFTTVTKRFPWGHVEKAKKCILANYRYCSKSKDYWIHADQGIAEDGRPLGVHKRSMESQSIEDAYELATQGKFIEISRKWWIKYHQEFEKAYLDAFKPEDMILSDGSISFFKNHFLWLQGPTGVGKSYHCKMIEFVLECFYTKYKAKRDLRYIPQCIMKTFKKNINKWWDNYSMEDIVVLEEMDPDRAKYMAGFLKIWCDQYTFPVEVKGSSFKSIRPKFIIVTSNYRLRDCFPNINDYEPLERRFSQINVSSTNEKINWPNLNGLKTEWDLSYHFKKEEQEKKEQLFKMMMDGVNLDIVEEPLPKVTDLFLGKKTPTIPSNDKERISQECFTPEQILEIENNYQEPPRTPPNEPGFTKEELMEMKNLDKNNSFSPFPAPPSEVTQPLTPTVILIDSEDEEEQPNKKNKGKEPATDEEEEDSSLNLNVIKDNLNYISDYIHEKEGTKKRRPFSWEEEENEQLAKIHHSEETPSKKAKYEAFRKNGGGIMKGDGTVLKKGKKKQPTMEETVYKKQYGYYQN